MLHWPDLPQYSSQSQEPAYCLALLVVSSGVYLGTVAPLQAKTALSTHFQEVLCPFTKLILSISAQEKHLLALT